MTPLGRHLLGQPLRVGFFHPWMRLGGSEAVTLWAMEALKERCELTLVTPADFSLRELNTAFGTRLLPWEMRIEQVPPLPGGHSPALLPRLRLNHFESHARRLAPHFDFCVSGYHPLDFGVPAIHLVGDFGWDQPLCDRLQGPLHAHHESALYRGYGWLADHFFHWRTRDVFGGGDLFAAHSRWVAGRLREHFACRHVTLLPPPVPMPDELPEVERSPAALVWIGHFTREKRFEAAVEILRQVRRRHPGADLTVVGAGGEGDYAEGLRKLAAAEPGLKLAGSLKGPERWETLARCSIVLHTNPAEAFGLAVCEAAACGCVPVVPAESGLAEVTGEPDLAYTSAEEAAAMISSLIGDPARLAGLSALARERALLYRPEAFMARWRQLVNDFADGRFPSLAA